MNWQRGFTVTELMVVVAIVAILLALGVPEFRYITNSYRMSAEVNGLLGDLQYTRAEAIKEGQNVTVCVSADSATCAGTSTWQSGWVVFSNPGNAPNPPVGSILRVQAGFTGTVPDTFVAAPALGALTYNREGFATTGVGFPLATLITLHDRTSNPVWTRCLTITPQGLTSTETNATSLPAGACL